LSYTRCAVSRQLLRCVSYGCRRGPNNNDRHACRWPERLRSVEISANYDRFTRVPLPLSRGANWDGKGVNFSLFSEASESSSCACRRRGRERAEDPDSRAHQRRLHIHVPGVGPGQLYGYRAYGPTFPKAPALQPEQTAARSLRQGDRAAAEIGDELFGYQLRDPDGDLSFDDRDSAPFAPLGIVTTRISTGAANTGRRTRRTNADLRGARPGHDPVASEFPPICGHVRGHGPEPIIKHLQALGITALELMPVHYFLQDRHLVDQDCIIIGIQHAGVFSLEPGYASNPDPCDVIREFRK